jgi:hypothetical protein
LVLHWGCHSLSGDSGQLATWALAVLICSVSSFDVFVLGIELSINAFLQQQWEHDPPRSILSFWLQSLFPRVRCSVAACPPCNTFLLQQWEQQSTEQHADTVQVEDPSLPALSVGLPVCLRLLDEVLQNVLALVPVLLPVAQQPAPSTSSSTGLDAAAPKQVVAEQCLYVLPNFLQSLASNTVAQLCGMLPAAHILASCIYSTEAPALGADAAVWLQHAAQLCAVLEQYARQAASSQAQGKSWGNTCQLVGSVVNFVHPVG